MLNIAIAGIGTVGSAVVELLQRHSDVVKITAISARDKNKSRGVDLSSITWVDNPRDLAARPDVDVVVELMGGVEGVAHDLAEAAIKYGKHFITANKALIATHGGALAQLAKTHKVRLMFEAAVAGGIPVIKTVREALAANRITQISGILNGTSNYILSRMTEARIDFAAALQEAQKLGYAEADPAADIDGHDSAQKLCILAALAFGGAPDLARVQVEGIRHVTAQDMIFADELGCRIKLIAKAMDGSMSVAPTLVLVSEGLAQVNGATNAVMISGDYVGDLLLQGQGAGAKPTASAVVADVLHLAKGGHQRSENLFAEMKKDLMPDPCMLPSVSRFYLRLQVIDKPGVVADVSAILRDEKISIQSLLQRGRSDTDSVPVVITTHAAPVDAMKNAAEKIGVLKSVIEKPCVMRMEG
jgi:homoserine dehydrogenase